MWARPLCFSLSSSSSVRRRQTGRSSLLGGNLYQYKERVYAITFRFVFAILLSLWREKGKLLNGFYMKVESFVLLTILDRHLVLFRHFRYM